MNTPLEYAERIARRAQSTATRSDVEESEAPTIEIWSPGNVGEVYVVQITFASELRVFITVDEDLQVTLLVDDAVEERYGSEDSELFAESTVPELVEALEAGEYVTSSKSKFFGREVTFSFTGDAPPLMEASYVKKGILH